jgi:hypothetical protein
MLPEPYRELLTAYVDGELSARQRRSAQKLLQRSPEARALLLRLQEDSRSLRALPPPPPTSDLSDPILHLIRQRGLRPVRRRVPPAAAPVPVWAAVSAAAAVLLAVGASSFLYFTYATHGGSRAADVARTRDGGTTPGKTSPEKPGPKDVAVVPEKSLNKDRVRPGPEDGPEVVQGPEKPNPKKPVPTPEHKPEPHSVLTAPGMESLEPGSADIALPSIFRLAAMTLEKPRVTLTRELSRHDAFYVEVLCPSAGHGFPRLKNVLRGNGIELTIDPTAQQRLAQPKVPSNYVLYLDDVTPEELVKVFQALGQDPPKADRKSPTFGQFTGIESNLVVCPMTADHRRRLSGYLGVDLTRPTTTEPPAGTGRKRQGFVMWYGSPPRQSVELKHFLEAHQVPRKGTVRVMLVLRSR